MDEKLRILKMVEDGTITAEQGAELMAAMNTETPPREPVLRETATTKKCSASL